MGKFIDFVYNRLINHYGENSNVDYMIGFKKEIDLVDKELIQCVEVKLSHHRKRLKEFVDRNGSFDNANLTKHGGRTYGYHQGVISALEEIIELSKE